MFGGLRKKLNEAWSGADFWDKQENQGQRQYFAQTRANAPKPAPAQTRSFATRLKDQFNVFDNGQSFNTAPRNFADTAIERANDDRLRQAVREARQMVNTGQITGEQARGRVLSNAASPTMDWKQSLTPTQSVLKPTASILNNTSEAIARNRVAAPIVYGAGRSAAGTGEGLAGLYDLATPGMGNNRFGKASRQMGENADQIVKAGNYNDLLYKGGQLGTELATFAIGGAPLAKGTAKVGQVASKLPGAARAINYVDDIAKTGTTGQKLVAKGTQYLARPDVASDLVVDTALSQGLRANRGQDISAGTVAQDLGIGLAMAGTLGLGGAAVQKGIKSVTSRPLSPELLQKRNQWARIFTEAEAQGKTATMRRAAQEIDKIDATTRRIRPLDEGGFVANPFYKDGTMRPGVKKNQIFDGVDGKPRFEFDDSKAKLKISKIGNSWDLANVDINSTRTSKTLGEVLDHPTLFKQYPDLKNVLVKEADSGNYTAAYNPTKNEFSINSNKIKDPEILKQKLVHEIQHAVQKREGFASGGNMSTVSGLMPSELEQIHQVGSLLNQVQDSATPLFDISRSNATKEVKDWAINLVRAGDKAISDFQMNNPYSKYRNLAGEAEARAAELRTNFSNADRQKYPFYDSLDVPKNDLIIRNSDGKAMSIDPLESLKQEARKYKSAEEFDKFLLSRKQAGDPVVTKELENLTREAQKLIDSGMDSRKATNQVLRNYQDRITLSPEKYRNVDEFLKAQGKPLYHGTNAKFDKFSLNDFGRSDQGFLGKGIYLTGRKGNAKIYGKNIVDSYVNLKNPLEYNDSYTFGSFDPNKIRAKLGLPNDASAIDITNALKAKGYDGVIVHNVSNKAKGKMEEVLVIDPSQIKTKQQLTDLYNQATKPSLKKKLFTPLDERGSIKLPGDPSQPPQNTPQRKSASQSSKGSIQDPLIQEYADLLRNIGEGNGVAINKATGARMTNNFRSPELKGKRMTKADWYAEAERQVKSGEADPAFMEYYSQMNNPEVQSLIREAEAGKFGKEPLGEVAQQPKITPQEQTRLGKQIQTKPVTNQATTPEPQPNLSQKTLRSELDTQPTSKVGKTAQDQQISQSQLSSKTRGFVKSVLEDPNTSPKVKESISSLYTVRNTKELQVKAANLVKQNRDVAVQLSQNASDDTSVAVAQELIKTLQKEGNYTQAVDLVEKLAEDLTKAGQTVQAASIYGRLTPEGILRFTQKEINRYNKATGKNIKLDPSKAEKLQKLASEIQKLPEGDSRQEAIAFLVKEVQETMPSTTAEKLSTFQTMAQLLNPKTNIRNVGGNTIFAGLENISQTIATPVDSLLSMFTGQRTTSLPSLGTQAKSGIKGGKKAIKEAYQGINTGQKTQFDLNEVPVFRNGVLNKLEKTMNATLRGADRAAYEAAFDDTVRSMMKAQGLKQATPEILEAAHHQGLYRTFQDSNRISDTFVGLKRTLNKVGIGTDGKRFGLGDLVLKYPKTPANLLARGIDYSPAGFIKATFEASKPLFGKQFNQKQFVDAFSRAVVGSGAAFGMGYILAENGIITAQPEQNKDLRNLQKTAGLGGYQINASAFKRWVASGFNKDAAKLREGDQLVSYDWAQPVAIPISAGAALGADTPKKAGQEAANTFANSVNTLVEQPLVQGVQRLFNSTTSLPENVVQTFQSAPASFVPTLSSQINQLFDNTSRNVQSNKGGVGGFVEGATNQAKAKVPGLAQTLPEQVDVLGNTKERYQGGSNNAFNVFLNPAFMSNYKPSTAASETQSIYKQTGETKQAPNTVGKSIKVNGENKNLSGKEQGEYQRYVGKNNSDTFDIITKDPRYQALPETEKANILSSLQSDVNSAGKITLFGDKPEKVSKSVDAIATGNLQKAIDDKLSGRTGIYSAPSKEAKATLSKWLPQGISSPNMSGEVAKKIEDLEKDRISGKIGKLGYEEKKKSLLRESFKSELSSDEQLILGSSISKTELRTAYESGQISDQSISKALAVEKKMFDAGLIDKEYLANKLGLNARGYKSSGGRRRGGGRKGGRKSTGKKFEYKLYGFGNPSSKATGNLQSILEKYI